MAINYLQHHMPNMQPAIVVMDSEQENGQNGQEGKSRSWAERLLGWLKTTD